MTWRRPHGFLVCDDEGMGPCGLVPSSLHGYLPCASRRFDRGAGRSMDCTLSVRAAGAARRNAQAAAGRRAEARPGVHRPGVGHPGPPASPAPACCSRGAAPECRAGLGDVSIVRTVPVPYSAPIDRAPRTRTVAWPGQTPVRASFTVSSWQAAALAHSRVLTEEIAAVPTAKVSATVAASSSQLLGSVRSLVHSA